MFTAILLLVIFAKPIYWAAKSLYAQFKNPKDLEQVAKYTKKMLEWLSRVWDVVSWQGADL